MSRKQTGGYSPPPLNLLPLSFREFLSRFKRRRAPRSDFCLGPLYKQRLVRSPLHQRFWKVFKIEDRSPWLIRVPVLPCPDISAGVPVHAYHTGCSVINSLVSREVGSSRAHPHHTSLISDQTSASASRGSIIERDFLWAQPSSSYS